MRLARKNAVYRFLNHSKFNWIALMMFNFVKQSGAAHLMMMDKNNFEVANFYSTMVEGEGLIQVNLYQIDIDSSNDMIDSALGSFEL